jgi:hypothetical protein
MRQPARYGSVGGVLVIDIIGWIGAACLLLAYALVSRGRVAGGGRPYQLLNIVGSIGLAVNTIAYKAWPSTALNAFWLAIGLVALARLSRTNQPA